MTISILKPNHWAFQNIHNMKTELPLQSQIEALLFFIGEPVKKMRLSKLLDCSAAELDAAIMDLERSLNDRGLVLTTNGDSIALGTHSRASAIIEKVVKDELTREIGRAGLETLSIILYKREISKREIDYIRGVNSVYILRNLLIRGLTERLERRGERGYYYRPTIELLAHLGLTKLENLPEYENVLRELEEFTKNDSKQNDDL